MVPRPYSWTSGSGILLSCGAWRSSVARLLWEQEVPGSNPGAPIQSYHRASSGPEHPSPRTGGPEPGVVLAAPSCRSESPGALAAMSPKKRCARSPASPPVDPLGASPSVGVLGRSRPLTDSLTHNDLLWPFERCRVGYWDTHPFHKRQKVGLLN
jgi:hypothetical protein